MYVWWVSSFSLDCLFWWEKTKWCQFDSVWKNQFDFQHKHYTVNIFAFVCDGPAREFSKSIKSHNAYYACERCIVHGRWEGRVLFDDINCNLRTNQSFIKPHHDHQIGKTPLIDSGIDCITQFPLDYMHLVCLGVMKRLLSFWKEVPNPFRLAPFQISQISRRFKRNDRINALWVCSTPQRAGWTKKMESYRMKDIFIICRSNCLEWYSETIKTYTSFCQYQSL